MKIFLVFLAASILAFAVAPASAITLPNGTCSGSGMTVTVKGGSITAYQFQGRSYRVTPKGGSIYKIGAIGAIRVVSVKKNAFKGIMAYKGTETPATFNCR